MKPSPRRHTFTRAGLLLAAFSLAAAACGSDDDSSETADPSAESGSITLVAYDSFPEGDTPVNDALDEFTAETGIEIDILLAGDTGTMLAKASLTAGNPEGDVMWGVDNTFLSRAVEDGVFEPYLSDAIDIDPTLDPDLVTLAPNGEATPVDFGDVCVNYDVAWFDENGLAVPETLDDLADPAYADLLVVENPATSSPGMSFLLATIDEYGEDGWQDFWSGLDANGVAVVDGWSEAYYEQFTWAGGGTRPMVVSYGTSPPAEVIFADPPRDDSPTGVIASTCFRQIEFAGILRGSDNLDAAQQLIDFLASDTFQTTLPLTLFVYPANDAVVLPQEFVDFAVIPEDPRTVDPELIDENRAAWIDEWTEIVLG